MPPQYPFDECPHEDKDSRGCSRSVHRTFSNSVARFWMGLRWSSKRPAKQFPTRFWMHHWKGFPSLNSWLMIPKKQPLAPRCWTRSSLIFLPCGKLLCGSFGAPSESHPETCNTVCKKFDEQTLKVETLWGGLLFAQEFKEATSMVKPQLSACGFKMCAGLTSMVFTLPGS